MEVGALEIFAGLVVVLFLAVYYYLTSSFNFWKKQNVPGPTPSIFGGNLKDVILGRNHLCLTIKKYYDDFKCEPVVGLFSFKNDPVLLLRDPDLIKDVLIKDFNVFSDRGMYFNEKDDLSQHLVNLPHDKWRPLRGKLSPVFTSGKLRDMFYLITTCSDHFEKYLEKIAQDGVPIEFRDLTAKFTIDSIGTCAFGINTNSFDENSEFRKHGRGLFTSDITNVIRGLLQEIFPGIFNLLGSYKYSESVKFIVSSMKKTMSYRKENNIRRNDFVDLLMDLQKEPEKVKNIGIHFSIHNGMTLTFKLSTYVSRIYGLISDKSSFGILCRWI